MKTTATRFTHMQQHDRLLQVNSTRKGGFSSGTYHGLNLGMHSGDDPQVVQQNRAQWFKELQIPEDRLVFPQQVHSANVTYLDKPGTVTECDALVTTQPNLYLTIQTADCFPVFMFDPVANAVAIIHSGWRGTSKNIVAATIQKLVSTCNSRPEDILAGIGPGVQQSCYQVDEKCAGHFDEKYLLPDTPGHFRLDVQACIRDQLLQAGILPTNLAWQTTCTHCDDDRYYSYRRDGNKSGRMMGVIGMRDDIKEP